MILENHIQSIPAYNSIPINYPLIITPIGCQFNFPNMIMYSGGFLVYYK